MTGAVALLAGILGVGFQPLKTSPGPGPGMGLGLVRGSLLVYLIPIFTIACIGLFLSTVFRNSGAAIVGTLMSSCWSSWSASCPASKGCTPTC